MQTIDIHLVNLDRFVPVEKGTSLEELAQRINGELGFEPINATVNNVAMPLTARLYDPSEVNFDSIRSESGSRTYFRTLCMIMAKALRELFPERTLFIEHSISKGYYFTVSEVQSFSDKDLADFKDRVDEIIAQDLPIIKETLTTEQALEYFRSTGEQHVVDILETSGKLYTSVHRIEDFIDTYNGSLAPRTGAIYLYDIIRYLDGFLIRVPDRNSPDRPAPFTEQPMMHKVIREQDELIAMLDLPFIGSINKSIDRGAASQMILVSEAVQEKQIAGIAERIAKRYQTGTRIVLVSGPSSSGKTTFTKRLHTQLLTCFIRPYMISLDDYFVDRVDTPLAADGSYDFESLHALDLPAFNSDLKRLLAGETVNIPTFDFYSGTRVYNEEKQLTLKDGDVLMLEGIHALNPALLPEISKEQTYGIYVSALTALGLDPHNPISTTMSRLIRRMVRDHAFRGYSALDTLRRWPGVRRGEEMWVFPFQENADDMFNSSMVYELAALRPFAEPILRDVPQNVPEYAEAQRLLRFLRFIHSIHIADIPHSSLLREFIGGSVFHY